MQFVIVHEIAGVQGRLRARAATGFSLRTAQSLAERLQNVTGLADIRVNARTGSVLFVYVSRAARRAAIFILLGGSALQSSLPLSSAAVARAAIPPVHAPLSAPVLVHGVPAGGFGPLLRYTLLRPFLPLAARVLTAFMAALPYLRRGAAELLRGRCNVEVLDASAMGISLLRRDFRTVGLLVVLLGLGEALEAWTRKKSEASLAQSLALDIDAVWVRRNGQEMRVPTRELVREDLVLARAGSAIPVDGVVVSGEAVVNQAAMTGEPLGVARMAGASVFAGTVVEEGELVIRPTSAGDDTRLQRIIRFIEHSESLKANVESRALRMADMAVPFTFLLAGLVWVLTRDMTRAASVLLVDYACALRLATPLAVLTAMREGASHGVLIKGGLFLEALAEADTVVFDKTGTLTSSQPRVAVVLPAPGGGSPQEVLRLAACLEEHFPHPVARAVVRQAEAENLQHREEHSAVEYVVAHGVASHLHGKRVLLGSRHYICHDEGIAVDSMAEDIQRLADQGMSLLYLAVDGALAGIIGIEDSLREEAASVVRQLRADGIRRIVMLTGDDARTAAAVAGRLGIEEYRAEVLPVDKADVIREIQAQGHKVIMVGDGINDAPALSAAQVGVSLRDGADLAREVADVVLTDCRLEGLLMARRLGQATLRRIHSNFCWNMGLNSFFLGASLLGTLRPGAAAVLHNVTTVGVTLNAMRPVRIAGPTTEDFHA